MFVEDIRRALWSAFTLLSMVGLAGECRDRSAPISGAPRDAGPIADVSPPNDAARADPTFHFRCDVRLRDPRDLATVIEKHGHIYWFCSGMLELETREQIEVLEDDGCLAECEVKRWKLSVGSVLVNVRVDTEETNLVGHGWREAEVETVVYPEVHGQSARSIYGNKVKRETDLIFDGNRVWHVHFSYEAPAERVSKIDEMIDRAHIPMCLRSAGCEL